MKTKKNFKGLFTVIIVILAFLGMCYGAYTFDKKSSTIAFSFFVVVPIIIAFTCWLKNNIAKKNYQTAKTVKNSLILPLLALSTTPGIALVWIVGAAAISFGFPLIENPFLVGLIIYSITIIGILFHLRNHKQC